MTTSTAFVGDVHGEFQALLAAMDEVERRNVDHVVLLGDYVDRGPDSKSVIEYLSTRVSVSPEITALAGNHERALLHCLATGDVRPLLRMAGAPTIRSYVGREVGADVFLDFEASIPSHHVEFLKSLRTTYEAPDVIAQHEPVAHDGRFCISGHQQVGLLPKITGRRASIDTGAGNAGGRLTVFLWPSRQYFQVDSCGNIIDRTRRQ